MKSGFLLFIALFFWGTQNCLAQNVSINDNGALPNAFSVLDVDASSNNKGILIPRMTSAQRIAMIGLGATEEGLTVYDETLKSFFFWDGSVWQEFAHVDNAWSLGGNSGILSGTNFIGTLDAQDLDIRTNNLIRVRISQKGQIEIFNTGNSLFIGEGAGENDDLTNNFNVFTGYQSGFTNTGGYDNSAFGYQALYSNTIGAYNTGYGYQALYWNTSGNYNASYGNQSLFFNTTGSSNTALGYAALYRNVAGNRSTAVGYYAMFYADNTASSKNTNNTAVGYEALQGSTNPGNNTGYNNTAIGVQSLRSVTSGYSNTAVGYQALYSNNSGVYNSGYGYQSCYMNTTGNNNTAYGFSTLYANTTGSSNTALGYQAMHYNVANSNSTAVGYHAMFYADNRVIGSNTNNTALGYEALLGSTSPINNTGTGNTAVGAMSLHSNTSGENNTSLGTGSLQNNTSGFSNTALGYLAGDMNTTGNSNTYLGFNADADAVNYSNSTALGNSALITASNQVVIGNGDVTGLKIGNGSLATSGSLPNVYYDHTTGLVYRSSAVVDESVTNEIQNLGQVLSIGNDGGASQIKNIADPTDNQDAVTKAYVDLLEARIEVLEGIVYGVTDVEGNFYNGVKIGNQIWMKENLRTTKYNDGSDIPLVTNPIEWSNLTTPGYCWYNNDQAIYEIPFGALYNWYTVNTDKLCPDGWHIPSDTEWLTMENYLIINGFNYDGSITGNKIAKSLAANTTWLSSINEGAVGNTDYPTYRNKSRFTAYASGYRLYSGAFEGLESHSVWWSATEYDATHAWYHSLYKDYIYIDRNSYIKVDGFSIRCLKD
jgi:uncharacterized protein (TIGR02145 family)